MFRKTSMINLVLMPFLLLGNDAREQLKQQIKEKETELWQIELLVKQDEDYYQELCDKLLVMCEQIMKKLTATEREQFKDDARKFDANLHNLILFRSISEPKFTGQRGDNQLDYKQLKFVAARIDLYSRKLSRTLDDYEKCAHGLFMLYQQLDALSQESQSI